MILILSENDDQSTSEVLTWLKKLQEDFIRINDDDKIKIHQIEISESEISLAINSKEQKIALEALKSFWYRRNVFRIEDPEIGSIQDQSLSKSLKSHLFGEKMEILDYLYDTLNHIPGIGSVIHDDVNKLIALKIAAKCGLKIPATFIINSKDQLIEIAGKYDLISKGVASVVRVYDSQKTYGNYTESVSQEEIEEADDTFSPSLFQENIPKEYELRIFYLNGKFYPMAIFSQSDEQTSVDFRKYIMKKPNRNVPYKLPKSQEEKLEKLMTKMKLSSGSIDLIRGIDGEYYFLEVNPVGQFGMVSNPCNYYLEKQVAEILANA